MSIYEYLDKSRLRLSKFFAYRESQELNIDDVHQAGFINSLRDRPKLFNTLRRIYLGSIIAAYLSVDIGKTERSMELLLDTNFIIGLLDLNSKESTHTCRQILDLSKKLGFKISVLPYTLEETELLIQRKANQLNKSFFQGYLDPESIFHAAIRRNLTKTELVRISSNLKSILEKEYDILAIANDTKYRNLAKFQYKKIFDFYKSLRGTNNWSAHHDTTAIAYVKEKRNRKPVMGNFMNANCWFVTNTPYDVRTPPDSQGSLPEIIRAGELLSLLWLSSPRVKQLINDTEFSNLGLTRLVSTTISHGLPSPRVLRELDNNFSRYNKEHEISADDTLVIANLIAKKRIDHPDDLNKLARKEPDEFIEKVKNLAENGRKEDRELQEHIDDILNKVEEMFEAQKSQPQKEIIIEDNVQTSINKSGKFALASILILFLSFVLWTFDYTFNVGLLEELKNYYLVKVSIQLIIIFGVIAIVWKKRAFWYGGFISLLILIIMLLKN